LINNNYNSLNSTIAPNNFQRKTKNQVSKQISSFDKMFKRDRFDSFVDQLFDERDRYFSTLLLHTSITLLLLTLYYANEPRDRLEKHALYSID